MLAAGNNNENACVCVCVGGGGVVVCEFVVVIRRIKCIRLHDGAGPEGGYTDNRRDTDDVFDVCVRNPSVRLAVSVFFVVAAYSTPLIVAYIPVPIYCTDVVFTILTCRQRRMHLYTIRTNSVQSVVMIIVIIYYYIP